MKASLKFQISLIFIGLNIYHLLFSSVYAQSFACDSSQIPIANTYYNEAMAFNELGITGSVPLLRKAIKTDTNFALAYYSLGEIYHKKAMLSKYDIKHQMHTNYYYRKASDNFLYALDLCNKINQYLSYFYLGEQYYYQKEYALAGHFLSMFIKHNSSHYKAISKAKHYLKNCEKWRYWHKKPDTVKIISVQNISTPGNETNPHITANGQTLYYSRSITQTKPNSIYNEKINQLYASKIQGADSVENWIFSQGKNQEVSFFSENIFMFSDLNTEGNKMYLYKPEKIKIGNTYIDIAEIYTSIMVNHQWQYPQPLPDQINYKKSFTAFASLSNNDSCLFFASNMPEGYGGMDLYHTCKSDDGKWLRPINLGPEINTVNNEIAPFIHYDKTTLYFASDGHFGLGGFDIFVSKKIDTNNWTEPQNLGIPINSSRDEKKFVMDARGTKAYFSSNTRYGVGGWDIYTTDIPKKHRPNEMIILNAHVFNADTLPANIEDIKLLDMNTNYSYDINFDKSTGYFSIIIPKKHTDYYIAINSKGNTFGNKIIEGDIESHTYFTDIQLQPLKKGVKFYLNNIHFSQSNSFEINSVRILTDFADYIKAHKTLKLKIIGLNPKLIKERIGYSEIKKAETAFQFLISKGVNKSSLTYKNDTTYISNIPQKNDTYSELLIEVLEYIE